MKAQVVHPQRSMPAQQSSGPSKDYTLPLQLSKSKHLLSESRWIIYGERKIGKTTLISQFEKTIFLMTEPGAEWLEVYQVPITSWTDALGYLKQLEKKNPYKTVCVDTGDFLYDLCWKHTCVKCAVSHPGEGEWGEVWSKIKTEYMNFITRLMRLHCGVIITSHAMMKEVTRADGTKFNIIAPTMGNQAWMVIGALFDIVAYYGYEGMSRRLFIRGSDFVTGGCRVKKHFLTPEGEPVISIPMGNSEEEAYKNLDQCFHNQQLRTGRGPVVIVPKRKGGRMN